MKTTIEIPDALLEEARRLASARATTVKALVVAGLRRELREQSRRQRFRLRDASFEGRGLQPEMAEGSWERLRELVYAGRGA
ncbi:MAG TPA: type II toxin-antitoxin system VapB family antitoxin [Thermoanaerobaculia bacterium]|nr:type II toxin-antitoxin system VapB family antitoxin [Thermoanaerobaculia bacterium]